MARITRLRGMTWDHARGYDPMVATARRYAEFNPGVEITWEKRSLQAFADRPIREMADEYDLIVIDHPHVGEVAADEILLALDLEGRDQELADLARHSVGHSHQSYNFGGHQWALAIDAAAPVASFRQDLLLEPPAEWQEVVSLARQKKVALALIPLNAIMMFMGFARSLGFALAEAEHQLMAADEGRHVLETMTKLAALTDPKCLEMDPVEILDWMGSDAEGPAYTPFGYGYTNYSRPGYCRYPVTFADAPGLCGNTPRGTVLGGTGIAVSSCSRHRQTAIDYAFWIAGAECQRGLFFESGGQPSHAAAWESDSCNAGTRDFFRNTRRTLETAWLRPRYPGYMQFQDRGGEIMHAFLRRELDIPQTMERLQRAYLDTRA